MIGTKAGSVNVNLIIEKARLSPTGKWEYQLRCTDSTSGLYEDGKWFAESHLGWA